MTRLTSTSESQSDEATSGASTSSSSLRSAETPKRKTRENVKEKGSRLLVQGRLRVTKVDGNLIVAECRGDSGRVYELSHDNGHWACSCPARTACSHLVALWLVTVAG